jgi:hypothetical protein
MPKQQKVESKGAKLGHSNVIFIHIGAKLGANIWRQKKLHCLPILYPQDLKLHNRYYHSLSFARAKAARKRRAKELKLARPSGDRKTTRLRPTRAPTESSRNYTRSTEKCHFKMTVKHDTNHMTHSTKTHKSQL